MKALLNKENIFDNENIFPIERESDKNESISNSENLTDSIDILQNTDPSTSIQNDDCYHNNQKYPKVKRFS